MRSWILALALAQGLAAAPVLTIYASLGPTRDSPNYAAFLANLQSGILAGGTAIGDPATNPAAWLPLATGVVLDPAVILWDDGWAFAPYSVWAGQSAPGGAFADETGTWLYLSLMLRDPMGGAVTLDGLSLQYLPGPFSYFYSSLDTYDPGEAAGYVGGHPVAGGTAGDTPVELIVLRGLAVYFDVSCSNLANQNAAFCQLGLTDEERFLLGRQAVAAAFHGTPFSLTYDYPGAMGPASFQGTYAVPEPGSAGLLLIGAALARWLMR